MDGFDEKYEIRFAEYGEIDEVMVFIDTYWRKNHILARDRAFFEYEMVIDGHVNFIIAKDKQSGEIHAVLGFLPASNPTNKHDFWYVIWKVAGDAMQLLGIEIHKRLSENPNFRYDLDIGMNPNTSVRIAKIIFKRQVAKMKHFYCLSEQGNYRVAKVSHYEEFRENRDCQVKVRKIEDVKELQDFFACCYSEEIVPHKDMWYIERRYFRHPIHIYQVYGLDSGAGIEAVMVCREQGYDGTKVLRIVDYLGKPEMFGGISGFLKDGLLKYEYIDFYCYGFDVEYVRQAGMAELSDNDTNIIPNYFVPYEAKNVDIWVGAPKEGCVFFKADGDQDRPG